MSPSRQIRSEISVVCAVTVDAARQDVNALEQVLLTATRRASQQLYT